MVLTYQTAYLKANHPLQYMTALINSEAGVGNKEQGYNAKVAEYVAEAQSMGIRILPPCVKRSRGASTVEGSAIRFGLGLVKRASEKGVKWILEQCRQANSFREFLLKCHTTKQAEGEWRAYSMVGKADLEALIGAGAFDVYDPDREKLLAMMPTLGELASKLHEQSCKLRNGSKRLKLTPEIIMAQLNAYQVDEALVPHAGLEARLDLERQVTGCYLSDSPFAPYWQTIRQYDPVDISEINAGELQGRAIFPGILRDFRTTVIKNGKHKGREMAFLTFAGIGADIEVVAFSDAWARAKVQLDGNRSDVGLQRGKVYLVAVNPDRNGTSVILDGLTRLSDTGYARAA